jgi:hypothetical protein
MATSRPIRSKTRVCGSTRAMWRSCCAEPRNEYDAILLDVDNGPEGLTRAKNDWLYSRAGLHSARLSLRTNGVLAVWSAGDDDRFSARLRAAGFQIEVRSARRQPAERRSPHVIWLAMPIEDSEDDHP